MRKNYTKTYHIIFDAFGVNRRSLNSEKFVLNLLLEIPPLVDMRILSGPNVVRDYTTGNEGLSGFAIITYSHISIHTFPHTREIFIDIFSCKPFDYKKVRRYLFKHLKVKENQVETLEIKYPWEQ